MILRTHLRFALASIVVFFLIQLVPAAGYWQKPTKCNSAKTGLPSQQSNDTNEIQLDEDPKPYVDEDAYSIYAILLESQKSPLYIIRSETESWSGATAENTGIKGDKDFNKVWGVVLEDYVKQAQHPKLLTRSLSLQAPYELVPKQTLESSFGADGGWEAFYGRYPSSGGFFWFSAIGFNPEKDRAIVQFNHSCGGLCGSGRPHFFVKENGEWREVSVSAVITIRAS